jgi:hypothetical protein
LTAARGRRKLLRIFTPHHLFLWLMLGSCQLRKADRRWLTTNHQRDSGMDVYRQDNVVRVSTPSFFTTVRQALAKVLSHAIVSVTEVPKLRRIEYWNLRHGGKCEALACFAVAVHCRDGWSGSLKYPIQKPQA